MNEQIAYFISDLMLPDRNSAHYFWAWLPVYFCASPKWKCDNLVSLSIWESLRATCLIKCLLQH